MKRTWTVHIDQESGDGFDALDSSLRDLAAILLRFGGVGAIAPHRVEQADGEYLTDKVLFKYDSYSPGLNRPQNGSAPVESEPEAVGVGAQESETGE